MKSHDPVAWPGISRTTQDLTHAFGLGEPSVLGRSHLEFEPATKRPSLPLRPIARRMTSRLTGIRVRLAAGFQKLVAGADEQKPDRPRVRRFSGKLRDRSSSRYQSRNASIQKGLASCTIDL